MFVADALGGWLVGQLADAGRKKLTELVLGSEQERALRRAADAAVWAAAEETSPSDGEQTRQTALVISEVFRDPVPHAPRAGPVMLLEGLQAAIARQLTVLDDPWLTGTGQSSADVLGVPGTVLADRLTGHLVREIIVRGSGGGPLTPLASQLNHELTRLQGQRVEGLLARLAGEIRDALARPDGNATVAGRLLGEVTDPFVLEVHRPVQPDDAPPGLPLLPPYVPREHDQVLAQVARAAADGRSGIAVLVGGSSTGKTRACWEALALLRGQDPPWRLWHPIDPSRSDAALRELAGIGPRTVVWLNEAQFYLGADGGLGEQVAAGLRELLRDPGRAPVLVLATLWPGFWDALTARPPGGDDRHAQARELLAGHDITVPAAFTPAQMGKLAGAADARMLLAARSAPDGEVIQFLAGAPELLARYRNAPPAARALMDAAMDARRLGMGAALPRAFLEAAAPGYLTGSQWDALGEDWLEQALAYTAVPCKGARGPLTRIRPRPVRAADRNRADQPAGMTAAAGPLYRLADYLDQHGRAHRASQIPPAEFWAAAAEHATPGGQAALGDAAHARGLYRAAAQLHKNAAASGNPRSAQYLSSPPDCLPADPRPAVHAALDNLWDVARLLDSLAEAGADEQAAALADRAAAHAPLDDPGSVAVLLGSLRRAGADEQAAALASRAAPHTSLNDPGGVYVLLFSLREVGAHEQAAALASRAAAHAPLDDPWDVARLLTSLAGAGAHEPDARPLNNLLHFGADKQAAAPSDHAPLDHLDARLLDSLRHPGTDEQAATLLARDPAAHVSLDDPYRVAGLLDSLRRVGAHEQAAALADRAAAHAPLDDPGAVDRLLDSLAGAGAYEQAAALADRAALDDPGSVAVLLDGLLRARLDGRRRAGADEQAAALLARDPAAHVSLDDPYRVAGLLDSLRRAGADEQAATLLARDPAAHAALDDPRGVAVLLGSLRRAGADEQAATLLVRDPAAHAALDHPYAVVFLLDSLTEAGADEQITALADRAAAHAPLGDSGEVLFLLGHLREAGADEQAAALVSRLPAAGMFGLFLELNGSAGQFRFGREADGTPAAPWGWENLDLMTGITLSLGPRRAGFDDTQDVQTVTMNQARPGHSH